MELSQLRMTKKSLQLQLFGTCSEKHVLKKKIKFLIKLIPRLNVKGV